MADRIFLSWPFFEPRHRELADELQQWCNAMPAESDEHAVKGDPGNEHAGRRDPNGPKHSC